MEVGDRKDHEGPWDGATTALRAEIKLLTEGLHTRDALIMEQKGAMEARGDAIEALKAQLIEAGKERDDYQRLTEVWRNRYEDSKHDGCTNECASWSDDDCDCGYVDLGDLRERVAETTARAETWRTATQAVARELKESQDALAAVTKQRDEAMAEMKRLNVACDVAETSAEQLEMALRSVAEGAHETTKHCPVCIAKAALSPAPEQPRAAATCPHGRPDYRACPHCLGINNTGPMVPSKAMQSELDAARLYAERLRTALMGVCEYAELIGSQTDDVHIAVMAVARAALSDAPPAGTTSGHRAPDFFDEHGIPRFVCECGTVVGLHEFGRHRDCEYYRHHCDQCHERGACTAHDDEIDIEPGVQLAPSSITPMPADQMPPSISVPAPPGMSDGHGGFKKPGAADPVPPCDLCGATGACEHCG